MVTTEQQLSALTEHSAGFAAASLGHLQARVEHCPDWSVADLVHHLSEVHWFWATIAAERAPAPPEESRRPARPADDELLAVFEQGAERLVEVLRAADQSAWCWTWAPWQRDVAFVTRHQVQEAAVHHWDAAHAAGLAWTMEPAVAADAVDEFLHFSVSSEEDEDDPPETALSGSFSLRADDPGDSWTLSDGSRPGTVHIERAGAERPSVDAPAADLLLWLYGRLALDTSGVPSDLISRFRGLCFTD